MKLVIATMFYEVKAYSPYISSLVKSISLLHRLDIECDYWELSGESYVDRGRNTLANRFMNSDYSHLIFIDSDMSWDLRGFGRLLTMDVDVVGCGYPCKNSWDFYGCVLEDSPDHTPIVNERGLVKAWGVPTGLMKIRREVFERLRDEMPDNKYSQIVGGEEQVTYDFFGRMPPLGEDVSFCRRWAGIGGDLWVMPDIDIGHMGVKEYKGNYHQHMMGWEGGSKHSGVGIDDLRSKHEGETAWIVGKGPSLSNLSRQSVGAGPVIAIDEAIVKVAKTDIPNPIYSMQKDKGDYNGYGSGIPLKGETLLVHRAESSDRMVKYSPRYVWDNEGDFGIPWWEFSVISALNMAKHMGCSRVMLVSMDASVNGDVREYVDGIEDQSYLQQRPRIDAALVSLGLTAEWILPQEEV